MLDVFSIMNDDILYVGQGCGVMAIECGVGIFKAFEEFGTIPGKALTSSGSTLFSSLYFSGHSTEWFEDLMNNHKLSEYFKISPLSSVGTLFGGSRHLVDNDGVKDLLMANMTGQASNRVRTSLTRLKDWEAVVSPVTPMVTLAATSIPLVFKPVKLGDALYVDGGVLNNIPVPTPDQIKRWKHIFVFLAPGTEYNGEENDPLITTLVELLQAVMDRELKQLRELKYFDDPRITVINPPSSFGGGLLNWSPDFKLKETCYSMTKELLENVDLD